MKTQFVVVMLILAGCSVQGDYGARGMLGRPAVEAEIQSEVKSVVQQTIAERCNESVCELKSYGYTKPLKFLRLEGEVEELSYQRVFRSSSNQSGDEMILGETPAWGLTGVFENQGREVRLQFLVRRDAKGMSVDSVVER